MGSLLGFYLLLVSTVVIAQENVDQKLVEALTTSNRNGVNVPSNTDTATCFTPNQEEGTCGPLSQCPQYIPLIRQLGDPNTRRFFRERICRIFPRSLYICCTVQAQTQTQLSPTNGTGLIPAENECGLPSGDRIVGGMEIGVGSWPWLTAVGRPLANNGFLSICGGTLLTQRHVLSAAHCFAEGVPTATHVRLGDHHLTSTTDGLIPLDVVIGDRKSIGYNPTTKENDIELLVLSEDVIFNDYVKPACLPINPSLRSNVFEGENATVVGWGRFAFGEQQPTSQVPMEANVPIVPLQPCSDVYETRTLSTVVDNRNICAGQGNADACSGDSGGPLNYLNPTNDRYYVIGVVSHGVECASSEFPGVYTRVSAFINWITSNIQ